MKKNICLIFCLFFLCTGIADAQWSAKISVVGQPSPGQNKSQIIIGEGLQSENFPAPPAAPQYSCKLVIPSSDWNSFLSKDIKKQGDELKWVLIVNPHGNSGLPVPVTATLSWESHQFEKGSFELREGWDGLGNVIVSDMNEISLINVTGLDKDQYFTIIQKK